MKTEATYYPNNNARLCQKTDIRRQKVSFCSTDLYLLVFSKTTRFKKLNEVQIPQLTRYNCDNRHC